VIIDIEERDFDSNDLRDNKNVFLLKGDATHDDVLENAGIFNAKALITTLPKDADNVFVTLTARQLNINIQIISRASEVTSERKLIRAGANNVVMPDAVGGRHMATLVTKPDVIEFLEMMNGIGHDAPKLDNLRFDELKDIWKGKSIAEMNIRQETGANVIAIKDKFGFMLNPNVDALITEGQTMIVLGYTENLEKLILYRTK
jgi:voltage-gated potassium channel